jgi:hypothetical protein
MNRLYLVHIKVPANVKVTVSDNDKILIPKTNTRVEQNTIQPHAWDLPELQIKLKVKFVPVHAMKDMGDRR